MTCLRTHIQLALFNTYAFKGFCSCAAGFENWVVKGIHVQVCILYTLVYIHIYTYMYYIHVLKFVSGHLHCGGYSWLMPSVYIYIYVYKLYT